MLKMCSLRRSQWEKSGADLRSFDKGNPFADSHHLRPFVVSDEDGFVVRVQRHEFNAVVVPNVFGNSLGGVVFFHGEGAAVFWVAHGVELDEYDAALAGALGAGAEEVPGAVLDLGLHRVAADAGDEHAGFDGCPGGFGPADFLGGGFRSPQAGGGFEAVNGDESGEFVFGGRASTKPRRARFSGSSVSGLASTTRKGVATATSSTAQPASDLVKAILTNLNTHWLPSGRVAVGGPMGQPGA